MKIQIKVNGKIKTFEVEPDEYLVDTLRKHHYYSVKKGCDTSSCGVCTVLLDGKPIASCSYLSVKANGHAVTTVEAIEEEATYLAELFGKEGADQCGFCNPGLALTVYAMKKELANPTDEDIRDYLVGNLCRCSGYVSQHRAIKAYMEVRKL
ncbi:(2Fe-2S)-binding protein [Petrocella sp. FN5]|uniref:(2Fe-2S)-binding protein n=1 Tax=Petrocella sp. FN5 TaxID=3032002 RepID=UPI0023D9BF19|nr:2Fe-2S iron-sulfur cluster-binding protein [Petrocella sp. FN5]MDF1616058.1 2Fe-2S iron-sulfur cluster-binding protein [Petrocella sp. FN5]